MNRMLSYCTIKWVGYCLYTSHACHPASAFRGLLYCEKFEKYEKLIKITTPLF